MKIEGALLSYLCPRHLLPFVPINGPPHEKTCLIPYASNKEAAFLL